MKRVRKYILSVAPFLLGVIFLCDSFAPVPKDDGIKWTLNTQLTVQDFLGKPISNSQHSAESFIGISSSCTPMNDSVIIEIDAVFHRNKSWIKKNNDTSRVIPHEQGHFDLGEVFARKLRKELSEHKFKKKNLTKYVNETVGYYNGLLTKEQDVYDTETNHSINEAKQKEWLDKIKKELTELDAYSSPIIKKQLKG
jgi:hypothetical protein